jgi:glycosyltransferase involved in cell wall biosynthesis
VNASTTHLVLVPSFDSGPLLERTVRELVERWAPVWVVVDASTDGSEKPVEALAQALGPQRLRMLRRSENGGKGAAVLTGAHEALAAGFTHALVMDADHQHPADRVADFMAASQARPDTLVLGLPVFGPEAPAIRLQGRKLSVGLVHLETLGHAVGDPLFGFRVYPLRPLVDAMARTRHARRYDFDPEVAVRMVWAGVPTLDLPAACRYVPRTAGGISHFHYFRDNVRMVWLHSRLLVQFVLWRWYSAWRHRRRRSLSRS